MASRCSRCSLINLDTAVACRRCGTALGGGAFAAGPAGAPAGAPAGGASAESAADLEYAALGPRIIAGMIDGILLSFIGTLAARLGAAGPAALGGSWGAVGFLFLLQAVIGLAYSSICEGISGATIGKALIGLRVRDVEGGRCSFGQALIRALMLYIDMIPYCIPAAVYLFSILRSPQRQRAGDAVARTVVVNLASLPEEERTSAATGIAIATPVILVFVVVGVLGGAFFAGPGMSPYGVFKR